MENKTGQGGDGPGTDLGLDKLCEELVYSVAEEIELERRKITESQTVDSGLFPIT